MQLTDIKELKTLIDQLISNQAKEIPQQNHDLRVKGELGQNHPNPFHQNTSINYFVPSTVKNAKIQITSLNGEILDLIPLKTKGKGQLTIKANTFPSGTYYYSLILDGQINQTKKMILNK